MNNKEISSQKTRKIRTLLVGSEPGRFGVLLDAFNSRLDIQRVNSLTEFLAPTNEVMQPELILVIQTFSDQFCPQEIDQLFERYPLARIVCVYGPLCESDGRTRQSWAQSVRVPLWRTSQRIEQEIAVLSGKLAALPVTATREETIHFEYQPFIKQGSSALASIVFSLDAAWAELIAETWKTVFQSDCLQIHSLERLGSLLGSQNNLFAEIIFDIDPFDQPIKQWLQARYEQPCKNDKRSSSVKKQNENILQYTPVGEETSSLNDQIIATSNCLIPHVCRELEQVGVKRYACKLNLAEIVEGCSYFAIS